jgi:hypothetical protein
VPDRALQRVVHHAHRPAGARTRHLGQHPADILGGQLPQGYLADAIDDGLQHLPVERDRLFRTAVQAFPQPVLDGLAHGVPGEGGLQVAVQLPELVLDVLLGLTGHLAADPLAVGTVAERHRAAPPAGAALVEPSVAAVAGVVEVDGVVTRTASTHTRNARRNVGPKRENGPH